MTQKKNRIRLLALAAAALLACASVAGCSPKQGDSSSTPSSTTSSADPADGTSSGESGNEEGILPEGGWTALPTAADMEGKEAGTLVTTYKPKYATGFSVEYYAGGAKIIATDIKATASTGAYAQRVLLLPEGATEPKDAKWDHKIDGNVERVVTLASSHAGHFSNLDSVSVIKGTSIKDTSCFIPALKTALENGEAQYVGSSSKVDKELVASLQPQVVFVGGMQSDVDLATKLEESGIFCFYFGDFAETHYMGRAQWIELIGAFIGKEQQAQDFMKNNESGINEIIRRTLKIEKKPSVLWFTHSSQAPHWNVRTSEDYVNSIVSAVGGQMLYPEGSTKNSVSLSNEDFLPLMLKADRIVFGVSLNSYASAKDITYFNKEGQIDFSQAPAFAADNCYVVGYDWAQDTANALSIISATAAALYPEEFTDVEAEKVIKFKV